MKLHALLAAVALAAAAPIGEALAIAPSSAAAISQAQTSGRALLGIRTGQESGGNATDAKAARAGRRSHAHHIAAATAVAGTARGEPASDKAPAQDFWQKLRNSVPPRKQVQTIVANDLDEESAEAELADAEAEAAAAEKAEVSGRMAYSAATAASNTGGIRTVTPEGHHDNHDNHGSAEEHDHDIDQAEAEEAEVEKDEEAEEEEELAEERELEHKHADEAHEASEEHEQEAGEKAHAETTVPPPAQPYQYMYDTPDAVVRDLELRVGGKFFPQGTHNEIDIPTNEQHRIDAFFEQEPKVFGGCILIRDFAEPLRVGSAAIDRMSGILSRSNATKFHARQRALSGRGLLQPGAALAQHRLHHHSAHASRIHVERHHHRHHGHFRHHSRRALRGRSPHSDKEAEHETHEEEPEKNHMPAEDLANDDDDDDLQLPSEVMLPKGGVVDKDTIVRGEDGMEHDDDGELQIRMFAFLRGVTGQVQVIPNGFVQKWSSKKKVPIAGYLCPSESGNILHTLPTPCVPTMLDQEALPFPPPRTQEVSGASPSASPSAAPAHAPAGNADFVAEGANSSDIPRVSGSEDYHVWVGSELLTFSSKPKAERFCKRLARRIAEDIGDSEWNFERFRERDPAMERNPTVTGFMQLAKKQAPAWTKGTKRVLVTVMDWQVGDKSSTPFSTQTKTVSHYQTRIFPRVKEAFNKMSYGQYDLEFTFVPEVIEYLRPRSRYKAGGYPFPGLYNGARESLAGNAKFGNAYSFDDFDLAYVISPQQQPTGTKGVAWVGAKGAMCNGCEEISNDFQVMVAVHELGHNLGLWHASSTSLEYGNIFDWMGNYPEVIGLSYGVGYKLDLGWIPRASVAKITDSDLSDLNEEYLLLPFDSDSIPREGTIVGIQVRLEGNDRDLYISYRRTAGELAGVYLTWQDRDKPNSELIDAGCHTPSQRDARLRPGWVYMDPSNQVVVWLSELKGQVAAVRVFRAPDAEGQASIRAGSTFTDGRWICPRTCTDSDLLVAQFKGCGMLAEDGYCSSGSINMGGSKFSVGLDLCPESCDRCEEALAGPARVGDDSKLGCQDKHIKISGMNCPQAAAGGYCNYDTNMGHLGKELCSKSCGMCPALPGPTSNPDQYKFPTPAHQHGRTDFTGQPASDTDDSEKELEEEEAKEEAEAEEHETEEENEEEEEEEHDLCTDDVVWTDEEGDGCDVYKSYIEHGNLTRDEACNYQDGQAKKYCRKTCHTCTPKADTCVDKTCVTAWREQSGKCFACADWESMCSLPEFRADCPKTCGVCHSNEPEELVAAGIEGPPVIPKLVTSSTTTTTTTVAMPEPQGPCEDHECVDHWLEETGQCFPCADFGEDFCGRDELFMRACPRTCKTCTPHEKPACADDFQPHTCQRYASWRWCGLPHVADHCKATCGVCARLEAGPNNTNATQDSARGAAHQSTSPINMVLLTMFAIFISRTLSDMV